MAVALLGVLVGMGLPPLAALRDRMAVRGARESAVGLFAEARARALVAGEAVVLATESPPELRVRAPGEPTSAVELTSEYGVSLDIPGPPRRAALRFDALGIGRMASRTLLFRRGSAEAGLVVSAYGRVRRR